jgi:predicted DNA-binding ribbon-helix-helix protein
MWDALTEICRRERCRFGELVIVIDQRRGPSSLTAAVRVFLLDYFRLRAQPTTAARHSTAPALPAMFGAE